MALSAALAGSTVLTFVFVNVVPNMDGLGRFVAFSYGVPLGALRVCSLAIDFDCPE